MSGVDYPPPAYLGTPFREAVEAYADGDMTFNDLKAAAIRLLPRGITGMTSMADDHSDYPQLGTSHEIDEAVDDDLLTFDQGWELKDARLAFYHPQPPTATT